MEYSSLKWNQWKMRRDHSDDGSVWIDGVFGL
jgi:hypothetical protein